MIDWFGPVLHEMYGGTESVGTTVITSSEWLAHPGSVGRPSAGTELHIVDEQGEECPVGVPGLIYMSSGKTFEYHGEAVKTAASRHAMGGTPLAMSAMSMTMAISISPTGSRT
ncbi:AMP-binding protein [Tistrella bauzanensis]